MPFTAADLDELRRLLCSLQDAIQRRVLEARDRESVEALSAVACVTSADTIYHVDQLGEAAILDWFADCWPSRWPVELVVEGLEDRGPVVFPADQRPERCLLRCIIDPIDGTRSFMFDKRSAWVLAGLAPQRGPESRLSDIMVAAMTELPVAKQRLADQLSAVRGCGREGIVAERVALDSGERRPIHPSPSAATDFQHGFVSIARFFPEAKALLARFEEALWQRLYAGAEAQSPMIFDDQYICTGGQLYELLAGRDRMAADLRPLALQSLGSSTGGVCHPYDICTSLIVEEAGCPISDPQGAPLDAALDTTTPIAWIGFANPTLASRVRPLLPPLLEEFFANVR